MIRFLKTVPEVSYYPAGYFLDDLTLTPSPISCHFTFSLSSVRLHNLLCCSLLLLGVDRKYYRSASANVSELLASLGITRPLKLSVTKSGITGLFCVKSPVNWRHCCVRSSLGLGTRV